MRRLSDVGGGIGGEAEFVDFSNSAMTQWKERKPSWGNEAWIGFQGMYLGSVAGPTVKAAE
jgi:hypothetical protein